MEDKKLNSKIEKHLDGFTSPEGISKEDAWKSIQHSIKFENRRSSLLSANWFRYAASVLLICTIGIIIYGFNSKVVIQTEGKNATHTLPDGSFVTLNARSTIVYNDLLWVFERELHLNGHAYFEVQKGETFKVITNSGNVEVLGTEFIVLEHSDIFEVSCFEGSVKVQDELGSQTVILSKGLATTLNDDNLIEPYSFNQKKYIAWKEGLFFFENESLNKVFDEIGLFYELEIEIGGSISDETSFSGVFNRGELKNSLEIICSSMGLSYEIVNGQKVRIF